MEQQAGSGGCLKVLAIALPIIGLAGFLFYKASQASGRASEVAERVVTPYLKLVQAGAHQQAIDTYGAPEFRKNVTGAQLKSAYDKLSARYGRFVSAELHIAQEQHAIGADSIVRANYTLKFEKADEHVAYDIVGEGEAARIGASYERAVGRDSLTPAPR